MKMIFTLLFVMASVTVFAQVLSSTDTLHSTYNAPKNTITLTGTATISTIGFSPVPSFSFDKPIGSVALSLTNKRLSYNPAIYAGLNGKPWIIENWLKYLVINKRKFKLSAGFNASLFFKTELSPNKEETISANRNVTAGLFAEQTVNEHLSFNFTYWYNKRCDRGTISGHFTNAVASISKITLVNKLYLDIKPELFYFNNTGSVDGLFASCNISIGHRQFPVSLFLQGVQPIWVNFTGTSFKWNTGVLYVF